MTGDTLKYLRQKAGLTQQQIADRAGWSHRTIVSALEKRAEVPAGSASKYLQALVAADSAEGTVDGQPATA